MSDKKYLINDDGLIYYCHRCSIEHPILPLVMMPNKNVAIAAGYCGLCGTYGMFAGAMTKEDLENHGKKVPTIEELVNE